ncbi:MAG: hypothetical protein AAFV07_20605, partial [Bacteroidota bacterium]
MIAACVFLFLGNLVFRKLVRYPQWKYWPSTLYRLSFVLLIAGLVWSAFSLGWTSNMAIQWTLGLCTVGALIGWQFIPPLVKSEHSRFKRWLHPAGIELILLWSGYAGSILLPDIWQPSLWSGVAMLILFIGYTNKRLERLRFYTLIINGLAAFRTIILAAQYLNPTTPLGIEWSALAMALILQILCIYLAHRYVKLGEIGFVSHMVPAFPYMLLYPTLLAMAVVLFQGFETQLLTMLWMLECLLIFALSIVLRDHKFRYTAMAIVIICMIRLPFFDLRQASTLERALSLVGVGLILILMDFIYKRFKPRFEQEQEEELAIPIE